MYEEDKISTKIYEVWHIETFEGGKISRLDFLKDVAKQLENKNKGVLFLFKTIDADKLETTLSVSQPDIISFGFGVGKTILPHLQKLTSDFSLRDQLLNSACFNNGLYAVPFMVSGYAMFTQGGSNNSFHCGQNGYIKPENIYNQLNYLPIEIESQYEAYKDFVYDKNVSLLGSARDVYRVDNLINLGRINANISPVDSYTDLIQYAGIIKNDGITNQFINLLVSSNQQNKLSDYKLFSSKNDKLYHSGIYNDMENAILKATVPNVFDEN